MGKILCIVGIAHLLILTASCAGDPFVDVACSKTRNIDCPKGGLCINNICRKVCRDYSNCNPDERCNVQGQYCEPLEQPGCDGSRACGNGLVCSQAFQCQSGHCVDGVCCNDGCTDTCMACTLQKTGGTDGVCAPVVSMTDPDGECNSWGCTDAAVCSPEKSWGEAVLIETVNGGHTGAPAVAMDDEGSAVVLFTYGATGAVWSNTFHPTTGWGEAVPVETDPRYTGLVAYTPAIAMDAKGNAVGVWVIREGSFYLVRAAFYTPTTGWGIPETISKSNSYIKETPSVAFNRSGQAAVSWVRRYSSATKYVVTNHYDPKVGWAASFEQNNTAPYPASVAIDDAGIIRLTWSSKLSSGHIALQSRTHHPTTGWADLEIIAPTHVNVAKGCTAASANGDSQVLWFTNGSWWSNFYSVATGWEGPTQRGTKCGTIPICATNGRGFSIAGVLCQSHTSYNTTTQPWVAYKTPGDRWTRVPDEAHELLTQVTNVRMQRTDLPATAVGPLGRGFMAWTHIDGQSVTLQVLRRNPESGDIVIDQVSSADVNIIKPASQHYLAASNDGTAVVLWSQPGSSGKNDIYAAHFQASP